MKQIDFSKLAFPLRLFVVVVTGVIGAGGIFFLLEFSTQSVTQSYQPIASPSPSPTPTSQKRQEQRVSLSALNNLEYQHSYCNVPMKLTDGVFRWTDDYSCNEEKPFGFFFQVYNGKIAMGDLNFDGKDDAAVILTTNYGGSGNFRELAVVLIQEGTFSHVASVDIGDRVIVNEIFIQNTHILLNMIIHAPEDGACCPTQPVQRTFRFDSESQELVEL